MSTKNLNSNKNFEVPDTLIVIGGGAAGFFCAVNAARMNSALKVTIVEKTGRLLSKVKVSGGGRCNVTHACFEIAEMVKRYPRGANFLKKAFHQFFTTDTISWFEERGVQLKTENDGRMFPVTNSSQTIIDCLLNEAKKYNVDILLHTEVSEIKKDDGGFILQFKSGQVMPAAYVCIASGGYPKKEMFGWMQSPAPLQIEDPVPSLFTFNLSGSDIIKLPGVSVPKAEIKIAGAKLKEAGPLLITHWGLSGPVVLKLSAWGARELAAKNWHFDIQVNWVPAFNENTMREQLQLSRKEKAAQTLFSKPLFELPGRLWEYFLQQCGITEKMRWADLPAAAQNQLAKMLCSNQFSVQGKTTFKEEFVTAGGVSLQDIDVHTMQSKQIPGIFFAGEALNIDGITGGFNFQAAWTTAWIAASSMK